MLASSPASVLPFTFYLLPWRNRRGLPKADSSRARPHHRWSARVSWLRGNTIGSRPLTYPRHKAEKCTVGQIQFTRRSSNPERSIGNRSPKRRGIPADMMRGLPPHTSTTRRRSIYSYPLRFNHGLGALNAPNQHDKWRISRRPDSLGEALRDDALHITTHDP